MSYALSSKDLEYIFHNEKNFSKKKCGVFAMDKIPEKVNSERLLIINSDMQHDPGQHWLCIYFPANSPAEFFDSLGKCPSHYSQFLINFLIENNTYGFLYNYKRIQCPLSNNCGLYCIYFLWERIQGISFEKFLNKFSPNLQKNENIVEIFFSNYIVEQFSGSKAN